MFKGPQSFDPPLRVWPLTEAQAPRTTDGPALLFLSLVSLAVRHRVSLIACVIVGLVAATIYARTLPPIYTSTATLLLEAGRSSASGQELASSQTLDTNRADSELQTIRSERLLSSVFDSLRLSENPELGADRPGLISRTLSGLRSTVFGGGHDTNTNAAASKSAAQQAFLNFTDRLHADRVGQSFVIEVSYSSSDPALPARVANAVVTGYILQAVAFKEQMARTGTEVLQGRLDSLSAQVEAAQQAMSQGELPAIATPDADARVIGAALPPLGPSAPRKMLITLLGGFLGLVAGFAYVGTRQAFDRKVHTRADLSDKVGIAFLGAIPTATGEATIPWTIAPQHLEFVSAVHDLRTSIEIASARLRQDKGIVIALVSSSTGAGVTTVCSSLAQLMTRGRRYVTLFQNSERQDLPDPGDHRAMPSQSLAGAMSIALPTEQISFEEADGLAVLPIYSHDANVNLFADFRNPRVKKILDALRLKGDVILDLPPLQASMDALALAAFADVTIFVARAGESKIDDINGSVQLLGQAGANVIGTVLNGA